MALSSIPEETSNEWFPALPATGGTQRRERFADCKSVCFPAQMGQ